MNVEKFAVLLVVCSLIWLIPVSGFSQEEGENNGETPDVEAQFLNLTSENRKEVKKAFEALVSSGEETVSFLKPKITKWLKHGAYSKEEENQNGTSEKIKKKVDNLVEHLGSKSYEKRKKATEDLEELCGNNASARSYLKKRNRQESFGPEVENRIKNVLQNTRSEEVGYAKIQSSETRLLLARCTRILGEIGTENAVNLLKRISSKTSGTPEETVAERWKAYAEGTESGSVRSNERSAMGGLKTLLNENNTFRSNDDDRNGVNDYWMGDVWALHGLKNADGNPIQAIPRSLARADYLGNKNKEYPDSISVKPFPGTPEPRHGYYVCPFQNYGPRPTNYDPDGNFRCPNRFAFMAFPGWYGITGRRAMFIGVVGNIYAIDAFVGGYNYLFGPPVTDPGTLPVQTKPDEPLKKGYKAVN